MRNLCVSSSPPPGRLAGSLAMILLLTWPGAVGSSARAADPPAEAETAVLHLRNGGFVPGSLAPAEDATVLRWQGTAFVEPFTFHWSAVNSIHLRSTWDLPKLVGNYVVELAGGDTIIGRLVGLEDGEAMFDLPRLGRVRFPRSQIVRMDRSREGSELVYVGPNGLMGWRQKSDAKMWREDAGQLVSEHAGAVAQADFGLPARAIIEFQLAWTGKPDFVLALGVDNDEDTPRRAFRFEIWESALVVHRETETEADVASVLEIPQGAGKVHLIAYLDQEKGRIVVASPAGKTLADMTLTDKRGKVHGGLHLANNGANLRLERLRISQWSGSLTSTIANDNVPCLQRTDGTLFPGKAFRYDPEGKAFLVDGAEGETRVVEDQVASLRLSKPADDPPRTVRVSTVDGGQLSGELTRVSDGTVTLSIPGVDQSLKIPIADLRSLAVRRHDPLPAEDDELIRLLELDDTHLFGKIVEVTGQSRAGGFAWKPMGSSTGSPLRPGTAGKIVSNWWDAASQGQVATRDLVGFRPVIAQPNSRSSVQLSNRRSTQPRSLYLRTGDVIPGEASEIDEKGVRIKSPLSETVLVPHDRIKAVVLGVDMTGGQSLTTAKRERLLMLPRLQKESPPTHIIVSVGGDYLRGRLIRMDAESLEIEVRLDVKKVPRERVAQIIWLHPEPPKGKETRGGPSPDPGLDGLVQAVCHDGIRLTFRPERVTDETLFGKSDVLGTCQVRLKDLAQLLVGKGIEKGESNLAFQQWTLNPAPEPAVAQAGSGESAATRPTGLASALVGKAAPDFELELLNGEKFHLAASKGKVVVLDFWATWCGPCLQAMPQVERVTLEFQDQDVRLIAVNLNETPKQITAMLERQKMNMTVALDREGRVAEQYKANAIPQTVIIDREGNVARLFVGSSPHLGDDLRDALKAVIAGGPRDRPVKD